MESIQNQSSKEITGLLENSFGKKMHNNQSILFNIQAQIENVLKRNFERLSKELNEVISNSFMSMYGNEETEESNEDFDVFEDEQSQSKKRVKVEYSSDDTFDITSKDNFEDKSVKLDTENIQATNSFASQSFSTSSYGLGCFMCLVGYRSQSFENQVLWKACIECDNWYCPSCVAYITTASKPEVDEFLCANCSEIN